MIYIYQWKFLTERIFKNTSTFLTKDVKIKNVLDRGNYRILGEVTGGSIAVWDIFLYSWIKYNLHI